MHIHTLHTHTGAAAFFLEDGVTPGPEAAPIYYDNVECRGTEMVLDDCVFDTDTTQCDHSEDAGVSCERLVLPTPDTK